MWNKNDKTKLQALLDNVNPFGFSANGVLKTYASKKDAYVDMMMQVAKMCPAGYIDIPLIMEVLQEIKCTDAVRLCKRRSEIVRISIDGVTGEATEQWEALCRRLLEVTNCEFDKECFIVARAEFVLLWAKSQTLKHIENEIEKQNKDNK
jgi:hypothetical protein